MNLLPKVALATLILPLAVIVPAAADGRGEGHTPVVLCHNGHTITVDDDAVPGHLKNHDGDYLGPCEEEEEVEPTETASPTPTVTVDPSPSITITPDVPEETAPTVPVTIEKTCGPQECTTVETKADGSEKTESVTFPATAVEEGF